MSERSLPLGARTPDELLATAQDPGLSDVERRAVDAWLDDHPEWRARARSYEALRAGAERSLAEGRRPPEIASMTGLWAAIDHPGAATRSGRPFAPPTAPPTFAPPVSLDAARARRRGPSWLLAAAAALIVGAVGTVIVTATDDGGRDTASEVAPTLPEDRTPGSVAGEPSADDAVGAPADQPAALARLREGADRTASIGTANVVFRSLSTSDVSGGEIGEQTGEDTVYMETVGRGQLELPDRSILTTSTTTRVGARTDLFPVEAAISVKNGERTFVRCRGEADFIETTEHDDTGCFSTAVSPDSFGPDVALEVIGEESFARAGITDLGTDTMSDGTVITGYQTTQPLTLDDGQVVDMTLQIWLDEDRYIRRLVSGADFTAGESAYPTNLVLSYELFDLGTEVDIPELD